MKYNFKDFCCCCCSVYIHNINMFSEIIAKDVVGSCGYRVRAFFGGCKFESSFNHLFS